MSESTDTAHTDHPLIWDASIDAMLAGWCDEAKCFEWMHTEAYSMFETKARRIAITSAILSAVAGLSNVIAGNKDINGFQLSWIFGAISIGVSLTNMLQEKLAYNSRAAEHRAYAIQWGNIRRKIEEQVGIPWSGRKDCGTFLKYLRQDLDSASKDGNIRIPHKIRDACNTRFGKIPNFDVPDICGDMSHTKVYMATAPLLGGGGSM